MSWLMSSNTSTNPPPLDCGSAEPRSNSLILRAANPARAALVRSLVTKLDQPNASGGPSGNIHVVHKDLTSELNVHNKMVIECIERSGQGIGRLLASHQGL